MFKRSLLCMIFPVLLISFFSTLTSCTYRYAGPKQPITLNSQQPCLALKKGEVQFHAFVTIVHSLDVQKWLLMHISRAEYKVVARVGGCRYPTRIVVTVNPEGLVTISRSNPNKISRVHALWLRRTMAELEKTFNHYRCKSIGYLLERVDKYWVKPKLLDSAHP